MRCARRFNFQAVLPVLVNGAAVLSSDCEDIEHSITKMEQGYEASEYLFIAAISARVAALHALPVATKPSLRLELS